jgi:hypothetical protein
MTDCSQRISFLLLMLVDWFNIPERTASHADMVSVNVVRDANHVPLASTQNVGDRFKYNHVVFGYLGRYFATKSYCPQSAS